MANVTSNVVAMSCIIISGQWVAYGAAGISSFVDCIDDTPGAPDNDTTYIQASSVTATPRIYFNFPAFSVPVSSIINWVQIYYRHMKAGSPSCNIRSCLRVASNYYENVDAGTNPINGTWSTSSYKYLVNPGTNTSWQPAQVNGTDASSLQLFGLYSSDTNPMVSCTMEYIEINYDEYQEPSTGFYPGAITAGYYPGYIGR